MVQGLGLRGPHKGSVSGSWLEGSRVLAILRVQGGRRISSLLVASSLRARGLGFSETDSNHKGSVSVPVFWDL